MLLCALGLLLAAEPPSPPSVGSSKDAGDRPGSSSSGSDTDDILSGVSWNKGKFMGWTYQPYLLPGGGLQINGSDLSVVAALDVGVKYWRKNWIGDLYVGGSYTTGTSLNGYEVHIGDAMGRREKWWGVTLGLEGFYNGYTYGQESCDPLDDGCSDDGRLDTDEARDLTASGGLDIPVLVAVGPKQYYLYGGITPSFLTDKSRQVNWSRTNAIGFGHEFEWTAGAGLKFDWVSGEIGIVQRVTVAGVQNTPTLTLAVTGSKN